MHGRAVESHRILHRLQAEYRPPESIPALATEGLLHAVPCDPGAGVASQENYYLDPQGRSVICRVHGKRDGSFEGTKRRPSM